MSYMTISSQENHHFSLCSYFHAHPTTLHLKRLGGPMHGPSPHLKFWGDRPPVPPRSPPLISTFGESCLGLHIAICFEAISAYGLPCACVYNYVRLYIPRQQKFNEMNGAHLVSPIRGELGYAHWPQLGTQFIALLGTKFGPH